VPSKEEEATMGLPRRYNPRTDEPRLQERWDESGVYRFPRDGTGPVYAIDTPPATVSGHLHLGHTYSYTQTDFVARFWRMNGHRVFYPMGYDDNGLPTGRYVEKETGRTESEVGPEAFAQLCLEMGRQAGLQYEVQIVADAVSSRTARNRDMGLQKAKDGGARLTTVELALFELLRVAEGPRFKEILDVVRTHL